MPTSYNCCTCRSRDRSPVAATAGGACRLSIYRLEISRVFQLKGRERSERLAATATLCSDLGFRQRTQLVCTHPTSHFLMLVSIPSGSGATPWRALEPRPPCFGSHSGTGAALLVFSASGPAFGT